MKGDNITNNKTQCGITGTNSVNDPVDDADDDKDGGDNQTHDGAVGGQDENWWR